MMATQLEFASGQDVRPEPGTLGGGVDADYLRKYAIIPLHSEDGCLAVAVATPPPLAALDALRQRLGVSLRVHVLPWEVIGGWLHEMSPTSAAAPGETGDALGIVEAGLDEFDQDLDALKALAEDAPVVKLAQDLLSAAIDARASDLHLEIFQDDFRVRQRVDGILLNCPSPPRKLYLPLISHLKLRAQMNIAERRLPQDGRVKLFRSGREVDLRISTVPTVHGESMAIRLLVQGSGHIGLDGMGLDERSRTLLASAITLPHGMILVTGPTGSGKTTTLYAILGVLNRAENKIITVEDPVEYQIRGINQIQVKPQIDLSFANALRAIVRQDPDVLMVGEIRDRETAEIAIQSALTGHLVFSTLHTNDAAGAPHRLLDMGVEPYLIASSVALIVAQRLVRTLCPECKTQHPITEADHLFLEQHGLSVEQGLLAAAVGCARCAGTGYLGRGGIFELIPVTEGVKSAILRKEPSGAIRRIAQREGGRTLYADGVNKVLAGITTLEELARVVRQETSEDVLRSV